MKREQCGCIGKILSNENVMIDYDINLTYDKQLELGGYGSSCINEGKYAIRIDYRLPEKGTTENIYSRIVAHCTRSF